MKLECKYISRRVPSEIKTRTQQLYIVWICFRWSGFLHIFNILCR